MSNEAKKKLSTKGIKLGGKVKHLEPGEHVLKINKVYLKQFDFMKEDESYHLVLEMETKPIPNFEGFLIDQNDPSKGNYKGQVGSVKTSYWPYKDKKLSNGDEISRDMDILRAIKFICAATKCLKWVDANEDKHETIEEYVEAFAKDAPFSGKYLRCCVGGKEYMNKKTEYMSYDLFLVKPPKGRVSFEAEDAKPSRLAAFNASDPNQVIRKTNQAVNSQDEEGESLSGIPIDDELGPQPEFEI